MSFVNKDSELDEEYCWSTYQKEVIAKAIKEHGSLKNAIVNMEAELASKTVTITALQEMIDWDEE
tara:strand:+ start:229 stop:423 length:195 start_codon:yes stop_codon:yes gene_type:complete